MSTHTAAMLVSTRYRRQLSHAEGGAKMRVFFLGSPRVVPHPPLRTKGCMMDFLEVVLSIPRHRQEWVRGHRVET